MIRQLAGLIPPYNVTVLLRKLAQITKHEMTIDLHQCDFLAFQLHQKRVVFKECFIIISVAYKRLNYLNNLWMKRHVGLHFDLVLVRLHFNARFV
jgi:hypothetical protein